MDAQPLVFVSTPALREPRQRAVLEFLQRECESHGLQFRLLGLADYSPVSPFQQIIRVIQECHGGLILGFEIARAEVAVLRPGTDRETVVKSHSSASSWNQIEAAVLLARELPVLAFRDPGVREGVFDHGASDLAVLPMPNPDEPHEQLSAAIAAWANEVRTHYEVANSAFDVFVSFSGEDEAEARRVFEFLTARGLRTFFSRESIPDMAQADYMDAINEAVDKARHMIIVSGSAAGFAKPWVKREWTMFLNEKLSGRKSGNVVTVLARPVPVQQLPITLRSQQVVPLTPEGLAEALKFVGVKR